MKIRGWAQAPDIYFLSLLGNNRNTFQETACHRERDENRVACVFRAVSARERVIKHPHSNLFLSYLVIYLLF